MTQAQLSLDPDLFTWLERYVIHNFRLEVKRDYIRDVARDIVLHLIEHKWWLEDAKAWRKYVTTVRKAKRRMYSQQSALLDDVADPRSTEGDLIGAIKGEHKREASGPALDSEKSSPPGGGGDPEREMLTPREVSQQLGISISTVYGWIHARDIAVDHHLGQYAIPRSELTRLAAQPQLRDVIEAVATARKCSPATARRFVTRMRDKGISLAEISNRYTGTPGA